MNLIDDIRAENLSDFKKNLSTIDSKKLLTLKFKIFQNFRDLTVFEYALCNLKFFNLIYHNFPKLSLTWETIENNKKALGYNTYKTLLDFLDIVSFEPLLLEVSETFPEEQFLESPGDEWTEEILELEDFPEEEEKIDDNTLREAQRSELIKTLDFLLKNGILKSPAIYDTDLLLYSATAEISSSEFLLLRKYLKHYPLNLRTEYIYQNKYISLMHLAIDFANMELFDLLISKNYPIYDFSYTMYNPVFEIWKQLTYSKLQKSGKDKVLTQMFGKVHLGDQHAYTRASLEFYLISKNEFSIEEAIALNKLKYISEISRFRGENNQTFLSIAGTPEIAEAILYINGTDPMESIPLRNGEVGIALQKVDVDVMPVILEEMKTEDIKSVIPWFIKHKEITKFLVIGAFLATRDPEDPYLEDQNLLNAGLTKANIKKLKALIKLQMGREECTICSELTHQKLECGHHGHYSCLSKMQGNKCAICRREFILPEPYQTEKKTRETTEKRKAEEKWRREYGRLLELYGGNIPEDELYKLTVETGI